MENIIELKDSKIITDILNKAFMTVALQFGFTKDSVPQFPAFIDADIIEKQLVNGLKMFGYKINDRITGCIGYSYYKNQIYFIERLATLPDYRHLGIGKKLIEFIENKIKEKGGKIAEIHVVEKNIVLRKWYNNLNYVETGIDESKTLPFTLCVMHKDLT